MKNLNFSLIKAYFVPILVIATIIILIPIALKPAVSNIKENNLRVQTKRDRLAKLNQKISDLGNIDETAESLKLIEVEKAVPSSKKLAPLIIGVGNLASKNNLIVGGMNFKPGKVATDSAKTSSTETATSVASTGTSSSPSSTAAKDEITFSLTLSGKLEDLKQFLTDLEGAKQLLGLSLVQVKIQEDGSYKFDFQVNAPFKSVLKTGDVVSQPVPVLSATLDQVLKRIGQLVDYTSVAVPNVPTGVDDPFK